MSEDNAAYDATHPAAVDSPPAKLTEAEKDQKLLDIAFEPDCNCIVVDDEHETFCAWRLWRKRMDRWDGEDGNI